MYSSLSNANSMHKQASELLKESDIHVFSVVGEETSCVLRMEPEFDRLNGAEVDRLETLCLLPVGVGGVDSGRLKYGTEVDFCWIGIGVETFLDRLWTGGVCEREDFRWEGGVFAMVLSFAKCRKNTTTLGKGFDTTDICS